MEKKVKNQKAKSKSSDGRKQLSSVRVIQRNLVYIVGLPLNLADEDVLLLPPPFFDYLNVSVLSPFRVEYFGLLSLKNP
jgi:CCR4-NOT transcription complex subunit 4